MRTNTVRSVLAATIGVIAGCTSSGPDLSGDCGTLTACCSQLSGSNVTACMAVVNMGDRDSCAEVQSDFEGDNLCGSSVVATSGSGCTSLATCCMSLAKADQLGCNAIVTGGDATACSQDLDAYQMAGMCSGGTHVGNDAGTGGGGCSDLSSCCSTLSADEQSACNEIVTAGDSATCSEEVTALKETGACGGSGSGDGGGGSGGCSDLSACCSTLSSDEQSACNEIVTAGDSATCSAEVSALQETGACGGGGGDGGGGGGGCSDLSSCCSTLPSADQSSCNEIVSLADSATCSAEVTALQGAGYCN